MRRRILALLIAALSLAGIVGLAAPANAGHQGGICTGHWYQGNATFGRGCYILNNLDPAYGYGQTDDYDTDSHCTVAQYNNNDGHGWHNITNSVSCGPIASWTLTYSPNFTTPGWWVRLVHSDGSRPEWIMTLNNCYTGYRC